MSTLLASIDAGFTLPTEWYSDPAIFRDEQRKILRRSWHLVTTTDRLAEIGDVVPCEIGGVPIVLVRNEDGLIRGYENICRHRAYPVVQDAGNRRTLQCHYHGWTYDLAGSLRSAPRANGPLGFDVADLRLPRVQVHAWGPMVWVNPTLDAPSFGEWTAGADGAESLKDRLVRQGCDVDLYVPVTERVWNIPANWKVFQDNTIECYHCPTTHPEFSRAIVQDPERQLLGIGGPNWIHHALPFRDDASRWYHFCWILPGTYIQHTGRGFDIGTVDIVDVDRLRLRHIGFAPPTDTPEQIGRAQSWLDADPTLDQDTEICRLVQRAHDSGVAPPGRLLVGREFLLTHLYRRIVEMMEPGR
jgi:nitrite reductase/ring-hydroxylating ferredoxin subunit